MAYCRSIIGTKLAPGVLDRYLGHNGYKAQQTSESEDVDRPHNLWKPVPGDHGAHGRFDSCAREKSWELKANVNRLWIGMGLGMAAAGAFVLAKKFL